MERFLHRSRYDKPFVLIGVLLLPITIAVLGCSKAAESNGKSAAADSRFGFDLNGRKSSVGSSDDILLMNHDNSDSMTKTVLDCGNCGPDFNAIRQMVKTNFGAAVVQAHGAEDALAILKSRDIDLVTINRKLDRDYSDGMEVLKAIKSDPEVGGVPVMIVTNYEEHQQAAVDAGGVRGFGKLTLSDEATKDLLEPYLAQ